MRCELAVLLSAAGASRYEQDAALLPYHRNVPFGAVVKGYPRLFPSIPIVSHWFQQNHNVICNNFVYIVSNLPQNSTLIPVEFSKSHGNFGAELNGLDLEFSSWIISLASGHFFMGLKID